METAIGNVPADWKVIGLSNKDVFDFENGLWTGKKEPLEEIAVLRNTNFNNDGTLDYSDVAKIPVEKRSILTKRLVPKDIVIERSGGGPKQPVGRVVLFDRVDEQIFGFSNFTSRLRVIDQNRIDPDFTLFSLLLFHLNGGTLTLQHNTTGIRNLKFDDYKQTIIPQPQLGEQKAIAATLLKIRNSIKVYEEIVAKLKELKAATMAKIFHEGLRGERLKQTDIGEIPEKWKVVRLGDYCTTASGGTPARERPEFWNGQIPWVKTGEINYRPILSTEEYISEEGLKNSAAKVFPKGTLLIALYGQGVTRGRVAFLGIDAATNQACAAIFPKKGLKEQYLYSYLEFAYSRIREFGHGANQRNLSAEILKGIDIPLPIDEDEQCEIYRILSGINERLYCAVERSGLLQSLFASILHLLMTGQVRVPKEK